MTLEEWNNLADHIANKAKGLGERIPVSRAMWDAYWEAFAELGPRHRNVARWVHDLGWRIDLRLVASYLAPETH